jgi:hypothetical protein
MPSYKILGQSAPSSAATAVSLYQVPSGFSSIVSSLTVTNTSSTTTSLCDIYIRKATSGTPAAAGTSNALAFDYPIVSNGVTTFNLGITLAEFDTISVESSVANILTFQAFGSEV